MARSWCLRVPIPEPLCFLEPHEAETGKILLLEEYGVMHGKLYENIARFGHIATTYAYPAKAAGRYVFISPNPALALGLSLGLDERSEIAIGKRADIIQVNMSRGFPLVERVWRGGERVI
jgi:hypothetical protein